MTDDQLRAMARRVLGLLGIRQPKRRVGTYGEHSVVEVGMVYRTRDDIVSADMMEDRAVAILREEMGKAEQHPLNDVLDSYEMTDEEAEALLALPATQTIVIDT